MRGRRGRGNPHPPPPAAAACLYIVQHSSRQEGGIFFPNINACIYPNSESRARVVAHKRSGVHKH